MLTNPAFTTVQARRTLGRPEEPSQPVVTPTMHTSQSSGNQPGKIDWPEPVRKYVQRSFSAENDIPGISREEMQIRLKDIITKAATANTLLTTDWDTFPLPQQVIERERYQPILISSASAPSYIPSASVPVQISQPSSKKRKSDHSVRDDHDDSIPPWRKSNQRIEDRISYATNDKRQRRFQDEEGKSPAKLEKRKKRFENGGYGTYSPPNYGDSGPGTPVPEGPVVGRAQALEKKYFRLTAPPNPETVRPLDVLRKTLDLLKKKWKTENNYSYICDQFKSLRQDLTVQHIKNDFTVSVYEIHARIALEKGDLGEYNQCQTQLRGLYSQKLGGRPTEFKAYRILYFIHTCNRTDMNDVLAELTPTEKKDPAIKHALDVRSALALGNYHRFFRLYLDTPNMGAYLMDMFVVRERLAALAKICRAYRPDVRIRFVTEELGFESDGETVQFLYAQGAHHLLEERDDGLRLITAKVGLLFDEAKREAFRKVDIKGQI